MPVKLVALWAAVMFLCLFADYFVPFPPGHLAEIAAGHMGPFAVSQTSLRLAALLMLFPAPAIALTPRLAVGLCRRANLVLTVPWSFVNIGNVAGESRAIWLLYGTVEAGSTVAIAFLAFCWCP